MDILFLGTSAGVPTRARNVTATAIRKRNAKTWVLVDCGEGTQQRVLRTSLSLNRLDAILITHVHGDHCYGLPGLLSSASMMGRETPLTIVGPQPIRAFLEAVQATTGLHLTFPIEFVDVERLPADFRTSDFAVEASALSHGVASHGYALVERGIQRKLDTRRLEALGVARGPAWGRLHRGEDILLEDGTRVTSDEVLLPARGARKVVIAGDNDTPKLLEGLCAGADVLVHEATYTREIVDRLGTDNGHSTAEAVAAFARDIGLPNLVLTHFSPRYQHDRGVTPSIADIEREARDHYRGTLWLANDFDVYRLSRDGRLCHAGPTRS
ncbi:RNAse Z [Modicisalibacter ilicicola DSM 19980]|uniref:Ribonuclease Z n=1 Tax=Modicisalibacter ilicicola DSM 19980 TaxID=1121942 RepID=A0A1M5DTC6_9GAMM|nr:MBL fold metallo-hydrolase [Halomonas ilicicola]SHF70052.1 RNAse Z [Halomonas ilicicola DSM 19980]